MTPKIRSSFLSLFLAAGLLACSEPADSPAEAARGSAPARPAVDPTGTVIEVKMSSIGGERFIPSEIEARRGDLIRFVLESGVHNVSFPADRNPAGVQLPGTSPFLQLPGQTYDVVIDFPAGDYFFQCDPHAALGMVGTIHVRD